jgi:hypothetical protein
VVPRRDGGHYLFTLVGRIDAADALQSASNAYREAALQVVAQ